VPGFSLRLIQPCQQRSVGMLSATVSANSNENRTVAFFKDTNNIISISSMI
jgi:hypothetical protein